MIGEIWAGFRRLPLWVQIWVGVILVPVNAASVFFWFHPGGVLIACLAIGGMLPNLPILLVTRSFPRSMALPHLLIWTPLVILLGWRLLGGVDEPGHWHTYLVILLVVDTVSLLFDYPDALQWWRERNETS